MKFLGGSCLERRTGGRVQGGLHALRQRNIQQYNVKFISTNMIIPQVLRTILIPTHKDRIEMEQMDVGYTFPIFFDLKNCLGSLLDPQASLKNG